MTKNSIQEISFLKLEVHLSYILIVFSIGRKEIGVFFFFSPNEKKNVEK